MNAVTITTRDRTKTATCREVLSMCGQYDVTVEPSWTGNGFLVLHDRVALPRVWPKCPDTCWAAPLMEDGSVLTYAKLVDGKSERHPDTGAVTEAGMLDLRERRLVRKMTKLVRLGGVGQIPYSVYAENGLGGMNMVGTGYMQILVAEPYSSPDGKDLDLFRPEVDPAIINELSGRISDNAEAIQVNAEAIDGVAADLEEAASELGSSIEDEEGERKAKDNELDGKIVTEANTRSAQIAALGSSKADKSSVYTKAQVQEMLAAQRNGRFIKVATLPPVSEAEQKCIYLVPSDDPETKDVYDEYYVVEDENTGELSWERIGSAKIDLSGYAKQTWVSQYFASQDDLDTVEQKANTAQQTAEGKQDALSQEQLDAIDDVQNKLDKSSGEATGLVIKAGSMAFKFEAYTDTQGSLRVGTINPTTGNIEWGRLYGLSASGDPGAVATNTDLSILSARLDKEDEKRLGIGNIYRLAGKTSGGADCNLVWYKMQTGSTVGNILGFTVDGVVKTVKSVYITASPSFPSVDVSVTASNNVSYDFSGTAETLNLHEVATTSAIPTASTSTPNPDGTGSPGSASFGFSCGNHVHPSDSTKLNKSGGSVAKIEWVNSGQSNATLLITFANGKALAFDYDGYSSDTVATRLWIAAQGFVNRLTSYFTAGNLVQLTQDGGIADAGWTAGDLARYALTTKTIDNGAVTLDDRAINIVTLDASVTSVTFTFPIHPNGKARDFFIRLIIQGTTVPTLYFNEPDGGGAVAFDADDDAWADIEPGVNILMFSDTAE